MRNIAAIIEAQLDALSLRQLRLISEVAELHGVEAYLVGGAVRDALIGSPVEDIDITVIGLTSKFVCDAATALNAEITASSQFSTFALEASGRRIDLSMARRELYERPGALPTVFPADKIEEDIARRDFTVNSMAVSINASSWGELLDVFDAHTDLDMNVVRVLHENSFKDDATRILRAVRYAVKIGFTLEEQTEHLIRRDATYLDTISGSRLRHEFERILQEGGAARTLDALRRLGIPQFMHPALTISPQAIDTICRAEHAEHADKLSLYLCILVRDMTPHQISFFTDRLALPSRFAQAVEDTGTLCSRMDDFEQEISRSETYMRLRKYDESAILACAMFERSNRASQRLMLFLNELRHIKPVLNGNDLLALGVLQGPQVGALLQELLAARLDGKVQTREDEIGLVRARLQSDELAAGSANH